MFTPPQSSITAIAPIKNERKIVSAPIAPSWHHIESTADTATEKPHMYTKKDFTAPEAPKVAPVQKFKFDLSSLKPEPVSVPTEKREIHESLSTPPTADVQKMQEVLTTFVEHTKHETPAPTHKVVVAPKPVIPSAVKQQTEQRPIMVPEAPVSQKEIPTPVSNVAPAVAPVPVTPPAPPVSVPKKVEPPILAEEPVRREPLPVRAPERTPVSVPPSTLPTGEPTPEIVQRRTPEPPPQIQEVAKFVPKPSPAVVPQTFGTESVQTTEAPQRSVPQQAPQAPTKEAEQIPALFQNPLFRRFAKWAVLGLIAIIGVTLAVVLSIYFNVFAPNEEINSEVLTIPSFFNTQTQAGIPLEGDSETFMKNLHEKLSGATSNTQIYPTQKEGEGFRIATAPEFLTFIGSNMNQKTKRALAEIIMIGSVQAPEAEPFIMVRSYNFDSLFAGFLAWEQYMYADLAPLFGTDPIPNPQFKDAVRGNASTRILYDSEGKEIMLYSFVNQNTVVITSSGEALAKIIEEL